MAQIILEPQEVFEHFHSEESTTTLLEGEIVLSIDGESRILVIGEEVLIPPNTPHKMSNTGNVNAIVGCGHGYQ